MSKTNDSERRARAWIEGWIEGKPGDIPLASDFVHTSPFGTVAGREKYLDWVRPLAAKNVASLHIVRTLAGDDEAVIWFEIEMPNGVVQCCDWVRTEKRRIAAVTSF